MMAAASLSTWREGRGGDSDLVRVALVVPFLHRACLRALLPFPIRQVKSSQVKKKHAQRMNGGSNIY